MALTKSRQSGFTLVELTVAAAITSMITIAILQFFSQSDDFFASNQTRSQLEQDALNIAEAIRNDLDKCCTDVASGWDLTDNTSFTGKFVTGYDYNAGENLYGSTVIWRVEASDTDPDNGTDDDGDGSIDEMQLVRLVDGVKVIKSDNIPKGSFRLDQMNDVISFQLFFEKYVYQTNSTITFSTNTIRFSMQ